MQVILGIIYHFIGGFASGSFYIPFKRVRGWAWESYWIIGGLFSWLIVPPLAAYLTIPDFSNIILNTDFTVLKWTYLMGVLWGIGGLTYGLGVRYLGVALGSSIILGLCAVFGSLIPSVYYYFYPNPRKDTIVEIATHPWGQMVLLGIVICIAGIVLCGKAGMMKEKDLSAGKEMKFNTEYNIKLGLFVAIISGVLSACFNFGLEAGSSMALAANNNYLLANAGAGDFLFRNNVIYVVLLLGGLTTNLVWCVYLNARNHTFYNYTDTKTPLVRNYLFAALAGTTWFLQFFFYGMGESRLGNGASSWILHMAFIILVANTWGLVLNEWKGVKPKTRASIIWGIIMIIFSVMVVGYGNSLKK